MGHRVITPSTGLPVDMDLVLSHLLMDDDVSYQVLRLLELYVGGAVTHIEDTCEHALARQTWAIDLAAWPRSIDLPGGNVVSVAEVSYLDASGVRQVLPPSTYLTRLGLSGNVRPLYGQNWPAAQSGDAGIEVTYDVGYEEGKIPKPLQQAILLMVGDFDANKGTKVEGQWAESPTVKRLLWPYRKISA